MFKKFKSALAILSSAFLMTGCFGGSTPPDDTPKDLTAEQKITAYSTLRTHAAKPLVDTTSTTGSESILGVSISAKESFDFTNSGLPSSAYDDAEDDVGNGFLALLNTKFRLVNGYKSNHTGYSKTIVDSLFGQYTPEQEFTKYENGEYINYYLNNEESTPIKNKFKVDTNYADNTYNILNLASSAMAGDSDLKTDNIMLSFTEILDTITENETFDDFVLDASTLSRDSLIANMDTSRLGGETVDISDDTTQATIKFTEYKKVYTLALNLNIEDKIINEVSWDVSCDITIDFDSTALKDINLAIDMSTEETKKSSEHLDATEYNATFTDNNTFKQTTSVGFEYSITTNPFNENQMSQSTTGYIGTGDNGVVENKLNTIDFIFADFSAPTLDNSIECKFGDNILNTFNEAKESSYYLDEFESFNLYWDKACTQAITADNTFPSYYRPIYFKVVLPENTAMVNYTVYKDSDGMTWQNNDLELISQEDFEFVFADIYYASSYTIDKVIVNGTVVTTESINLNSQGQYNIEIYCH